MDCFVIMPFSRDFDDVYTAIRFGVEEALGASPGGGFRLDERQPAGRITDRLLKELETASFCVADLTGSRPNVMWEVGYAMALGCPTILLAQRMEDIPFDLQNMQSLQYDRTHLSETLTQPLRKMVVDTISAMETVREPDATDLTQQLLVELADMKTMLSSVVGAWGPEAQATPRLPDTVHDLERLQGAWISSDSDISLYAQVVGNELVTPYSFGQNKKVTGMYYDWRKAGDYWFARYVWLDGAFSGFTFLKQGALDRMSGAWWDDRTPLRMPDQPPDKLGVPIALSRVPDMEFPAWAKRFIQGAENGGLARQLADALEARAGFVDE